MAQKCTYKDCEQIVYIPNDDNLCVFHHPQNNGVGESHFNQLFSIHKLRKNDFNFEGFYFNYYLDFKNLINFNIQAQPIFRMCKFLGKSDNTDYSECVSFREMTIPNADFSECEFNGRVNFNKTRFNNYVIFKKCKFTKGEVNFQEAKFEKADFSECEFTGNLFFNSSKFVEYIIFKKCKFSDGEVNFQNANLDIKLCDFSECIFLKCSINFDNIISKSEFPANPKKEFYGWIFNYTKFKDCNISFNNATFENHDFRFDYTEHDENYCLSFRSINFKGYNISFDNMKGVLYYLDFYKANIYCSGFRISNSECFTDINFDNSVFQPYDLNFDPKIRIENIKFNSLLSFESVHFKNCSVEFLNVSFLGSSTNFNNVEFDRDVLFFDVSFWSFTSFKNTKFNSNVEFHDVLFASDIDFYKTNFSSESHFEKCNCRTNSIVNFRNLDLNKGGLLYFKNFEQASIELGSDEVIKSTLMIFEYNNFIPHRTIFENMFTNQEKAFGENILLFRYCLLKDVYFIKNQMTLFSFYKSLFDEAIFISCEWDLVKDKILFKKYNRPNVIFEDKKLTEILRLDNDKRKEIRNIFKLENLDFKELENMYRRLKTALDKSKNYWQAGWFYFNEYEMKRLDCKEKREIEYKKINWFRSFTLYLYRLFAGYGEKPHWSLMWFCFFCFVFSILHLFNGININHSYINYDFNIYNYKELSETGFLFILFKDWISSIIYSFARILPLGYFKIGNIDIFEIGIWDFLLQLGNTVMLILFATFVGIGLKRYFRRF